MIFLDCSISYLERRATRGGQLKDEVKIAFLVAKIRAFKNFIHVLIKIFV